MKFFYEVSYNKTSPSEGQVAAGVELDELKEELRSAKEKNEAVVKKVDRLFNDRTRWFTNVLLWTLGLQFFRYLEDVLRTALEFCSKEQSYKAAEEKIQFLEAEIRRRIDDEVIHFPFMIVIKVKIL